MVWKFCEIWKCYGNRLSEGAKFCKKNLTVWGMACMQNEKAKIKWFLLLFIMTTINKA